MIAILRGSWVIGGAERYLTTIGESLRRHREVCYFSLDSSPTPEALHVLGLRHLGSYFRRWPADSSAIEKLTEQFDLFINGASHLLIEGRARENWLIVFSPGTPTSGIWPRTRRLLTSQARRIAFSQFGHLALGQKTRTRLALHPSRTDRANQKTYERIVGISEFVRGAIHRKWGIKGDLLYPSVNVQDFYLGRKTQKIVSVGRFAPYGNRKQHPLLIDAFRELHRRDRAWELHLVGGLEDNPSCKQYIQRLREQASDLPVEFHVNISSQMLKAQLATSSIYWHAAGYGVDELKHPDEVEHFGISVVEAMASGAIPIAFRAGGVPEIIDSGRNGFLWRAPSDLVDLTLELAEQPLKRQELSEAAVTRSLDFDTSVLEQTVRRWYY